MKGTHEQQTKKKPTQNTLTHSARKTRALSRITIDFLMFIFGENILIETTRKNGCGYSSIMEGYYFSMFKASA